VSIEAGGPSGARAAAAALRPNARAAPAARPGPRRPARRLSAPASTVLGCAGAVRAAPFPAGWHAGARRAGRGY